ncbi:MAG: Rv3654c family TadE-like protein [Jatrophihabitantaceae bacterium]
MARAGSAARSGSATRSGSAGERGSASVWVLACCGLLVLVGTVGVLRTQAVLGRHRAEGAADLAALAAAGQIGVSEDICTAARSVAAANAATVDSCVPAVAVDGRSGTVRVQVTMDVRLPVVGDRSVVASARAGRDPP